MKRAAIFSLFNLCVSQVTWLEAQYVSKEMCEGVPNALYEFTTADPEATKKGNETWPNIYTLILTQNGYPVYPYYTCGNLYVNIPDNCCYTSLDLAEKGGSAGVLSGMDVVLPETVTETAKLSYFPVASNDKKFCQLSTVDSTTTLGYKTAWYLQDGSCVNTVAKSTFSGRCHTNGSLILYSQKDCGGSLQQFELTSSAQSISTTNYGPISAKVIQVSSGSQKVSWVAYEPYWLLVPAMKNPAEVLAAIAFAVALFLTALTFIWTVKKYLVRKRNQMLFLCFTEAVWLCWLAVRVYYIYTIFWTDATFYQTKVPMAILLAIASACTAVHSTFFFNTVLKNDFSKNARMLPFIVLPILHFLLAGSQYANIYQLFPYTNNGTVRFVKKVWEPLFPYWIMTMFIWNVFPLIAFLYKIVNMYGSRSVSALINTIYTNDKSILALIAGQILTIVGYYAAISIRLYSASLGSDRVYLSLYGWDALFLAVHAIMNCFLTDRVVNMLKLQSSQLSGASKLTGMQSESAAKTSSVMSHA